MSGWVAGAIVVGAVVSSEAQKSSADKAANAQSKASAAGIAEQQRQLSQLQELLQPYTEAGLPALEQQQALLGLAGPEAQQAAISGIYESPAFQAQARAGEEALLQNASATGGLRGGNTQAALAQFRPSMLSQAIQQQYGNLAGMTSLGQQSAAGVGAAGMQTGQGISGLMQQAGAAQAGNYLAQGQANQQMINSVPQAMGTYYGMTGQTPFGGTTQPTVAQQYGTTAGSQQTSMLAAQNSGF